MLVIYCLLIGMEPKDHRRVHHLRCSPRGGFERIADVSKSRRRFERRYISRSRKPRDVSLRNLPAAPYFFTRRYRDVSHGSLDIGPPPLSRMYLLAATWPPRIFSFPFDPISRIFHPPIKRKVSIAIALLFLLFFSFLAFSTSFFGNSGTDVHDCSSSKSNEGRYSEEDRREKMVGFRNGGFYEPWEKLNLLGTMVFNSAFAVYGISVSCLQSILLIKAEATVILRFQFCFSYLISSWIFVDWSFF